MYACSVIIAMEKMNINLKLMVLFLAFSTTITVVLGICNISIIIAFPLKYIGGSITTWKRGLEILAGGYVAVNDINNHPSILSHYKLHLVAVDSGIDEYDILEKTIDCQFHECSVDVVGVCGFLSPKAVTLLLPLGRQSGRMRILSAPSEQITQNSRNVMQAMIAPSTVVNVLHLFLTKFNWIHNFGIIIDNTDAYFFRISEMLLQSNIDLTISPYIELSDFRSAINEIIKSNTKVIFIGLSIQKAVRLICEIYTKQLLWPKYAWIVLVFDLNTILEEWTYYYCDIKAALNGILLMEIHTYESFLPNANLKLISGVSYSMYYNHYLSSLETIADKYNTTLEPNAYAMVIYDALWRMIFTLNDSYYQDITSTQWLNFSTKLATTFHIRTPTQWLATYVHYNSTTIDITLNETALNLQIESSGIGPPIGYTAGFAVLITITALLVTIMLVLYIYFHKEPEIKATSFSLSLFMFTGCYFNLFYIILLYYSVHTSNIIDIQYQYVMCNLFLWSSAPGISLPLMLAVLLVKILLHFQNFQVRSRSLLV